VVRVLRRPPRVTDYGDAAVMVRADGVVLETTSRESERTARSARDVVDETGDSRRRSSAMCAAGQRRGRRAVLDDEARGFRVFPRPRNTPCTAASPMTGIRTWCRVGCLLSCLSCGAGTTTARATNSDLAPHDLCTTQHACPPADGSAYPYTTEAVVGLVAVVGLAALLQWRVRP
jgi:hypothetical protein